MFISKRGIFGFDSDGFSYGLGPLGAEGARTKAVGIILANRLRNTASQFIIENETCYNFLIAPTRDYKYASHLTSDEASAYERFGIPLPLTLWRTENGSFSRKPNVGPMNKYYGSYLPS